MENFIIPDAVFDRLVWKSVEVETLHDILTGSTVLGVEPVGLPNALDGVLIYFQTPENKILVMNFDGDPYGVEDAFLISVAFVDPDENEIDLTG